VQQNIQQYYATQHPGQVQVIGVDIWNGSPANVTSYRNMTGVTFPLLMLGNNTVGGHVGNLYNLGQEIQWDDYIVINKQGIIRYHSLLMWPHTNRYHLDELRGAIDSLVTQTVGVEDGVGAAFALGASPNPARGRTTVAFTNPGPGAQPVEIAVHDVTGRRIAKLWDGPASAGVTRVEWDGRGDQDRGDRREDSHRRTVTRVSNVRLPKRADTR
jgi:hypothetical protein